MQYTEDPAPAITPLWINDILPGGSGSSPVISFDRSRLYVTDNVDSLHAIDLISGVEIWSYPHGWASGGNPSLSPEGVVMVAGGGPLLAIKDGGDRAELMWRNESLPNRSIPIQVGGGITYAVTSLGSYQNELIVVDTVTGAILDRDVLPGTTIFTVGTTVDLQGTVYVPTINGKIFAFKPSK